MYRTTADDVDPSAQLYASARPVAHNPVDPSDVGPFEQGPALGITQGDWLDGVGHAVVTFHADARGNASLDVEVSPCLQLSGRQLLAGLAAAYHSDGMTYGGLPGEFGILSHLHVVNFLPGEAEALMAAQAAD